MIRISITHSAFLPQNTALSSQVEEHRARETEAKDRAADLSSQLDKARETETRLAARNAYLAKRRKTALKEAYDMAWRRFLALSVAAVSSLITLTLAAGILWMSHAAGDDMAALGAAKARIAELEDELAKGEILQQRLDHSQSD